MHLARPTPVQSVGVAIAALGALATLRWVFHLNVLNEIIPGFSEMGIVSPLLFLFAGTAFIWQGGRACDPRGLKFHRTIRLVCLTPLIVLPLLMLIEHVGGISLGVDLVPVPVLPTPGRPFPGRLSPNACAAFLCAGFALWLLSTPVTPARRRWALGLIAATAVIAVAASVGYALRLEQLYQIGSANRMVLPTVFGVAAIALGLWLRYERWTIDASTSFDAHEKRITRRAVVVLIVVASAAGIGGFAVIEQSFELSQSRGLLFSAKTNAASLVNTLETSAWFPSTLATRPTVTQTLDRINHDPKDAQARDFLAKVGQSFLSAGVTNVSFKDLSGAEVARAGIALAPQSQTVLALSGKGAGWALVWQRGFVLRSELPVFEQGRRVGDVAMEQRLPLFDKLISDVRESSPSSDVLICSQVRDAALCAPSRYYAEAVLIPMLDANGKLNLPINHALVGETGVVMARDLRGISVIAAFTPLQQSGLGMVIKTDVETLYAPVRERVKYLVALIAALVVVGTWAMRSQMRPLVAQLADEQRRTGVILENSNDAFVAVDEEGKVTDWNSEATRTFGWEASEAVGRDLAGLIIPAESRAAHNAGFARFRKSGTGPVVNQRIELTALHRDGRAFPVELSVASFHNGSGYVAHAFVRDITSRLAAQKKLADSENRLKAITDNLPVLISYIDAEHRLTFANKTFETWLGIDPEMALDRPLDAVIGSALYEQRKGHLAAALAGERIEFEMVSDAMDTTRHLQTIYIPDRQADGSVAGIYTLSTDVTANKLVERRLEQLARVDSLTGLPNRRQFDERLEQAISRCRRTKRPMALIFTDIDHFKTINDSMGHGAGDAVLTEFGARLDAAIRITDTAARLAGDEFVIILEGLNAAEEAYAVAEKLADAIRQPMVCLGRVLHVTASMGLAFYEGVGGSPEALIERADRALYRAKKAGRDTFAATTF